MEELITRISANVGIDAGQARTAVAAILAFLQKEGPEGQVAQMMDGMPGARELASESEGAGMMASMMPGVMGLGSQLMGMGLGMGEITGVSKETIAFAREKAGDAPVDEVIASIPGLGQFV